MQDHTNNKEISHPPVDTFQLVHEFHTTFDVLELAQPGIPPRRNQFIRQQLMLGEMSELCMAIAADDEVGVFDALCDFEYVVVGTILVHGWNHMPATGRPPLALFNAKDGWKDDIALALIHELQSELMHYTFHVASKNLADVADCLTNLNERLQLVWMRFGMADIRAPGLIEVHRSNMSKLDAQGDPVVSASGKVAKGPNFFEPDLKKILDAR